MKKNNQYTQSVGGSSAHAQMLNEKSRKYFTRAFVSSGSVNAWQFRKNNHVDELQECLQTKKTGNQLSEYLKTAKNSALSNCNYLSYVPVYESSDTKGAFISETPDEIYNSTKAPVMDAMFSYNSQVFQQNCIIFLL